MWQILLHKLKSMPLKTAMKFSYPKNTSHLTVLNHLIHNTLRTARSFARLLFSLALALGLHTPHFDSVVRSAFASCLIFNTNTLKYVNKNKHSFWLESFENAYARLRRQSLHALKRLSRAHTT